MKILCEVQVVNRVTQANRTPRAVKSTLAIGYKQSALDSNGNTKKELEMIFFQIPVELGRLPLTKLVLLGNCLGELNDWSFLNGIKLSESLCELDLSAFAMRRLKKLHSLYVSDNKLESLPAALEDLHINTLDVCGNAFKGPNHLDVQRLEGTTEANTRTQCSPQPLWLQAARSVDQFKLPIYSLPAILINLIAETPKCVCGKFCFFMDSLNIYKRIRSAKFERINNYSYSPDQFIYVDIVKCGYCKNVKSCA